MTVLHLTVGLPGTGKTTLARRLESEGRGALRLTKDEWMKALFGDANPSWASDVVEGRLVEIALRGIGLGVDAILDFGLWSRDERSCLRELGAEAGATVRVHYCHLEPDEQRRRLAARWAAAQDTTWAMTEADLDAWAAGFDVPTPGELDGSETVGPPPPPFDSWDQWRRDRWPARRAR